VPWLLGIARNHARRRLSARQHEPLPDGGRRAGVDADSADGIARTQQVNALRQALGTLPVAYREAVVLCDLQELSYHGLAATRAGCADLAPVTGRALPSGGAAGCWRRGDARRRRRACRRLCPPRAGR
jgi:hypothetical protein